MIGVPSGLQRKKAPLGAGLKIKGERRSFLTRFLETITAQGVGVRDAHVAASVRAGSGVPFIRLSRVCGI